MRRIIAVAMIILCAFPFYGIADAICKTADIGAGNAFLSSVTWTRSGDEWSTYEEAAYYEFLRIAAGQRRSEMKDGFCHMFLSAHGDDRLGLLEVTLNVCVLRTERLDGRGIMISADETRYEFAVESSRESFGGFECDRFELPLNKDGMEMLRSIAQYGAKIFAYGDNKSFIGTVEDAAHLTAFLDMLPEWYGDYMLWEENAAYWDNSRPQAEITALRNEVPDIDVDPDFNILNTDKKENVLLLQELLRENGFYVFEPDGKSGAQTVSAIKAAQRRYGFIENGIADLRLIETLSGRPVDEQGSATCGSFSELTFEAYRISRELRPCGGLSDADAEKIAPESDDLVLLTAIGKYTCEAPRAQDMAYEIEADLVIDGCYSYPCSVRCEYPGCARFGTKVMPLQSVRLLLVAEVPASALKLDKAELIYTFGNTTRTIILDGINR